MYFQHFGLQQYPFSLTTDTDFFLEYGEFKDALDVLECALYSGEGLTKITGETGTGKTLLSRKIMTSMDSRFVIVRMSDPAGSSRILYMVLARALGIANCARFDNSRLLRMIQRRLLALHADGRQAVLLMDESQDVSEEVMGALRQFSNMETEKRKLLQMVLFGQPELDVILDQTHLRSIRQRIMFSHRIKPLMRDSLNVYVQHRLHVAGYRGMQLFSSDALTMLQKGSGGVPRIINILAHKAMLTAFGRHSSVVDSRHVQAAIEDTDGLNMRRRILPAVVSSLITPTFASV